MAICGSTTNSSSFSGQFLLEFLDQQSITFDDRTLNFHPLLLSIAKNDFEGVDRVLIERKFELNSAFPVITDEDSSCRMTPLQVATKHGYARCSRSNGKCRHYDCMLDDPASMISFLISHGADFNKNNMLINIILWQSDMKPLNTESDLMIVESLRTRTMAEGATSSDWETLRLLYEKNHIFIFAYIQNCIEQGLHCCPAMRYDYAICRTIAIIGSMWHHPSRAIVNLLKNLWLCDFPLSHDETGFKDIGAFRLLPDKLQNRLIETVREAASISKSPLALSLIARSQIRRLVPLRGFKSKIFSLTLPRVLNNFLLYVENFP